MSSATMNTIHNRTAFSLDQIRGFPHLGRTVSEWRQRSIDLYQHPGEPEQVVSVGVTFDGAMTVVAVEPKTDWTVALDYARRGKCYVSK